MAKLTTSKRNHLPASSFAGPNRSYPVNDRSHAANAKARASQQYNAGHISASEKAHIDVKANHVLHSGSSHTKSVDAAMSHLKKVHK